MTAARKRERYAQRRAAGRCVDCAIETIGGVRCPVCALKHTEKVKRWQARRAA